MSELLLRPIADAFMQVGVFVALLVVPFGWARLRWGHRLDDALRRHRALAPLVAAALTMPPGCAGAIIVVAAYARGAVSYGAVVAALVATMGDASWVLLAADPWLTVQLKMVLLVVGAATGYAVDAVGVEPRRNSTPAAAAAPAPTPVPTPMPGPAPVLTGVATMAATSRVRVHELGLLPLVLWVALGTGVTLSVPVTFQLWPANDLYLVSGVAGTLVCCCLFLRQGGKLADDDTESSHPTAMTQVLRHGGREIAFVTVWVAVAYVAWSLLTHATGFDGSQLPLYGVAGVVVGACVGLVPGCAIQIVFAGIFVTGGMPLSTLMANTVSQDGDALIPLLALEHRSALLATVLTTIPALAVGSAFLVLT
jgi:hypothetical protein